MDTSLVFVIGLPLILTCWRPSMDTFFHLAIWQRCFSQDFRRDKVRCQDGIVVLWAALAAMLMICVFALLPTYAVHPVAFAVILGIITAYCLGNTLYIVGQLKERQTWLQSVGAVRGREHFN